MATKKKPAGAAIYYHPNGFDTSRPKLMGRSCCLHYRSKSLSSSISTR